MQLVKCHNITDVAYPTDADVPRLVWVSSGELYADFSIANKPTRLRISDVISSENLPDDPRETALYIHDKAVKYFVENSWRQLATTTELLELDRKIQEELQSFRQSENRTEFIVYANNTDIAPGYCEDLQGTVFFNIPAEMTHKQVIRTVGTAEDQDIYVDWGDGSVDVLSNGDYEKYIAPEDSDTNRYSQFTVSHTYSSPGKYKVTIAGTTYWGLRTPKYKDTDGYDIGHSYNLICEALSADLKLAESVSNLSDFLRGASRLLTLSVYSRNISRIVNLYGLCRDCINLYSATGFPINHTANSGAAFSGCVSLTTADLRIPAYLDDTTMGAGGSIYAQCGKLAVSVESLLPVTGFSCRYVNIDKAFEDCASLTPPIPAKLLWEDENKLFVNADGNDNRATIFSGCSDELLAAIPVSWGGTLADIRDNNPETDVAEYTVTTPSDNVEIQVGVSHAEGLRIEWGDGDYRTVKSSSPMATYKHTYKLAGTYTIKITGVIHRIAYANNNITMGAMIDSISKFPAKTVTSLRNTFARCSKIIKIPSSVTTEGIEDMYGFCRGCEELVKLPTGFQIHNSVSDVSYAFSTTRSLRWDISNLFQWFSGRKTVTSVFINASNIYGIPDDLALWNAPDIEYTDSSNAFSGCPDTIRKYAPVSWAGLAESAEESNTPTFDILAEQVATLMRQVADLQK